MTHYQAGLWLRAMKSGGYPFGTGDLQTFDYTFCALGVLSTELNLFCEFNGVMRLRYPTEYLKDEEQETFVAELNDSSPTRSFQEVIADVEGALEEYITE